MNGVVGYGGYYRIFGVGPSGGEAPPPELEHWYAVSTWKYSWPDRVGDFLCFAETAFGDPYAYKHAELGRADPPVYILESLCLTEVPIDASFEEFLGDTFIRGCEKPFDSQVIAVRKHLGDLQPDQHSVYVPSPLISATESAETTMKMPAETAMILGGDLATQLHEDAPDGAIVGIEPYEDDFGRSRVRVLWAP